MAATDDRRAEVHHAPQPEKRHTIPWIPAVASVAGAAYAIIGYGYGLGDLSALGPGALPFLSGVATAVVGAVVAVSEIKAPPEAERAHVHAASDEVAASRFGLAVTLAIVALTCVVMIWQSRIIGLLPAAGLGTAVLAWTMRCRPLTAALTGLGFYLFAFLLFQHWLEIPLSRGYF